MGQQNSSDRTTGSIWRTLLRVSAPMSVGIFGVLAIGLADAYFLARAGASGLAAIGFIYPVIVMMSALALGLSAGVNTAMSQALGAGGGTGVARSHIRRLTLHGGAGLATLVARGCGLGFAVVMAARGGPL